MSEWTDIERHQRAFEARWHARYVRNAWVSGVCATLFVLAFGADVGMGAEMAYPYGAVAAVFLCDFALDLRKLGVPW